MAMKKSILIMNYFSFCVIAAWIIFPFFYYLLPKFVIFVFISFWFLTALGFCSRHVTTPQICTMMSIFWLFYIFTYHLIGLSNVHINIYFQCFFFFFFMYAFLFYNKWGSKKENARLLKILFLFIFISFFWGCVTLIINPLINNYSEKDGFNVGNTPYSFFVSIVWICAYLTIKETKGTRIILLVLSLCLILLMSRTITILVTILFLGLFLIQGITGKNRRIKKILLTVLLFLALLAINENSEAIVSFVATLFGDQSKIAERLNELNYFAHNGIFSSMRGASGSARIILYQSSIKAWLSTPETFLFGNGWIQYESYSIDLADSILVGGHSELFDSLAKFGVLGTCLFFGSIIIFFSKIKSVMNDKRKSATNCFLVTVIVYSILNRFATEPSVGLGLFFIFPISLLYRDCDVCDKDGSGYHYD